MGLNWKTSVSDQGCFSEVVDLGTLERFVWSGRVLSNLIQPGTAGKERKAEPHAWTWTEITPRASGKVALSEVSDEGNHAM